MYTNGSSIKTASARPLVALMPPFCPVVQRSRKPQSPNRVARPSNPTPTANNQSVGIVSKAPKRWPATTITRYGTARTASFWHQSAAEDSRRSSLARRSAKLLILLRYFEHYRTATPPRETDSLQTVFVVQSFESYPWLCEEFHQQKRQHWASTTWQFCLPKRPGYQRLRDRVLLF